MEVVLSGEAYFEARHFAEMFLWDLRKISHDVERGMHASGAHRTGGNDPEVLGPDAIFVLMLSGSVETEERSVDLVPDAFARI